MEILGLALVVALTAPGALDDGTPVEQAVVYARGLDGKFHCFDQDNKIVDRDWRVRADPSNPAWICVKRR